MDSSIITLVVALLAIVIAWKFLKGVIKTVVLVGILVVAALVVFGGGIG
ncbi:hypothetical protein [Aurantiacibacter spongiae]|nr:hypothetical protein [Aurantiacibacter spongiae]